MRVRPFFLILAQKAHTFQPNNLPGWLHRVAREVALNIVRSHMRRMQREEKYANEEAVQRDVADGTTAQAVLDVLDEEVRRLPSQYRDAVILRYLQTTVRRLRADGGMSLSTFAPRMSRGLEMLRKRLAARGYAVSGVALVGVMQAEAQTAVPAHLAQTILTTFHTVAAKGMISGAISQM